MNNTSFKVCNIKELDIIYSIFYNKYKDIESQNVYRNYESIKGCVKQKGYHYIFFNESTKDIQGCSACCNEKIEEGGKINICSGDCGKKKNKVVESKVYLRNSKIKRILNVY